MKKKKILADGAFKIKEFDQLNQPGPLLRRCHQRSHEIYGQTLGDTAPTRQQLAVVLAIRQLTEPTQAAIAARTGVDRNTIADIIRRLTARGYVERLPHSADSRALTLSLTAKGTETVERLMPKVFEVQQKILAPLPKHLRANFLKCLRLIARIETPSNK